MADAAIAAALSKLGELAVSEAKILLHVGDDIVLLRDRLEWLQAFVRSADRRRRAGTVDGLTRVWVRQTRDVAFEAEDTLDDFLHKEEEGQDSGRRWKTFCRCFTGFGTKLVVRHGLSDRIKMIKNRLDQISVNQKEYNIVHTPSAVLASSTTAIAAWRNDLENAVGFGEDVITVMRMLSLEDVQSQKPRFISIVGESGAGKNTLARIICRMMTGTRLVVRYNMEPGDRMENVLRGVLELASLNLGIPKAEGGCSYDYIHYKIRDLLGGKRYLLILGGISSKTTLNCLRASLPDEDGNGGQVMLILDTENEEVGWHANTLNRNGIGGVHTLTRLDRERSGELFFWKVFRKGEYSSSSHGKESKMEEYEKKLDALKQKRKEEEKKDYLKQTRDEEEKQASLNQAREREEGEAERAALKKERFDARVQHAAIMREREEKGKTDEQLAVLKKKREEKEKTESEEKAALKKEREEIKKEEEHKQEQEQAAVKKRKEKIKKEQEQELAALKQKIEEGAADRDLHERLVHDITGGYPMAIVLLAGLLRFKEKPGQWNAVLQQLKSGNNGPAQDGSGESLQELGWHANTLNRDGINGVHMLGQITNNQQGCSGARRVIEIVFWASFEDLPNDLKSCYLYFACYPSNFSHSADTIVRLWIAEGFIRRQKGKTMEEVGYDYLKELVLRCLVEVEEMKVNGSIKLVRIHRSLMGFLQSEVRDSSFVEIYDIDEAHVLSSVRRLSVQSDSNIPYTTMFAGKKFPKLRSFICHIKEDERDREEYELRSRHYRDEQGHHQDLRFLCWSKFLRVISVQGLRLHNPLIDVLCDRMIHLQYLRIDCPYLFRLPSSIVGLLNLQTLDISNTKVEVIDLDFWKIKTLRHVLACNLALPTMVVEEGELQTLHGVRPDNSHGLQKWRIGNCPLYEMTNLRSLEIHSLSGDKHGSAIEAALEKMHLLGHLHLYGDQIPSSVLTNPSLRNLQTMKIQGSIHWNERIGEITAGEHCLRMVRPNLVQLKMCRHATHRLPESIQEQLEGILIQEEENACNHTCLML